MTAEVEAALSFGLSALESGYLNRETIPRNLVETLRDRKADIAAALRPATRGAIAKVLASLNGMPSQSVVNTQEMAAMLRQDVDDLEGLSEWALDAAARAFRRGEVGDGKWRPTTGQLRKEARARETQPRGEAYKIGKLLDAPAMHAPRPEYIPRSEVDALHERLKRFGGGR